MHRSVFSLLHRITAGAGLFTLTIALTSCASGGAKPTASTAPVAGPTSSDAPRAPSDGLPTGFRAAFADADNRARAVLFYQQCSATIIRLRATGTFGATTTAPRAVYCERTADGVPIGGVYDIDSAFTRARRVTIVRLDGARPRYTEPIDTARLVKEAQLVRDVTKDVAVGWRLLKRPFVVAPVVQADGTIEGWVLPLPTKARSTIVGGDIGMVRASPTNFTRIADHLATWKQITIPTAGGIQLVSAEREVPAVADLVAARSLAELGRDVSVATSATKSSLVSAVDPTTGSRLSWQHASITP